MASDDKVLVDKADSLTKAVRKNEPASNIIPILEYFKKIPPPNEDALRTTKIGVVIGKLRHHGDKEIKQTATEIVMKWKKSVDAAKKAHRAPMASPSGTPAAPSPAPAANTATQVYKGDPEKRNFTIDGVDNKRTGDSVRDGCIGLLYNGLAFRSTDPVEDVLLKAIEIEKAGYDHFNGPTDAYRKKIRSLFQNLKNKTNRELGIKLMNNDISPVRFIKMTHEELKSAEMKKQEEKLEAENMKKAQVPMAEKSISTALTCGKCGQKKVSYTQAQTRSADEPMTTFCECLICGNRWKFS